MPVFQGFAEIIKVVTKKTYYTPLSDLKHPAIMDAIYNTILKYIIFFQKTTHLEIFAV